MKKNDEHNVRSISFIVSLIKTEKKSIILMASILLAVMGASTLLPLFTAKIIDDGFQRNDRDSLIFFSILLFVVSTFIYIFYYICERIRLKTYRRVSYKLKSDVMSKLLKIDISYYNNKNSVSVFQQTDNDIRSITGLFGPDTVLSSMQIVLSIGYIFVLFFINWKLTIIVVFFIPIKFIITMIISNKNIKITKQLKNSETKFSLWYSDLINGMKTIRIFNITDHYEKEFALRQKDVLDSEYEQGKLNNLSQNIQLILLNLIISIIYIFAGIIMTEDHLSIGLVVSLQTYSLTTLDFITNFLNLIYGFSSIVPSAERYLQLFNIPSEKDTPDNIVKPANIKFEGVCFGFEGIDLFDNLNLNLSVGKKYAITGRNGIGKTTIINLILRFYSPIHGDIKMGNTNIETLPLDSYRSLFSVISQDCFFFNDSIRNNICLFNNYDEEKLLEIISDVQLSDLINEKSIDYNIGDNGCNISGGQRQKIALARAIICDRPFVILDEATSNIDKEWAVILEVLLNKYLKEKTVIWITHKNDAVKMMDEVITI